MIHQKAGRLGALVTCYGLTEGKRRYRHEQIQKLAQEAWIKSGCPRGRDEEIWLQAEHEYDIEHKRIW